MPIVKSATSSLAQGVSQQAESQRYPSQASEQINAYSSPIKGLVKRPPSKHISTVAVDGTADCTKSFLHTINRDAAERYVVVVNKQEAGLSATYATNTNLITASGVADDTVVSFYPTNDDDRLPTGLNAGESYYALSASPSFEVSKTLNGSAVDIGASSLSKLTIESIYDNPTGRWIDGVYTVTLPVGPSFEEGECCTIKRF